MFKRVLILCAAVIGLAPTAAAQDVQLRPKDESQHRAEADLWLDTVFGHCMAQVSGETVLGHSAKLQGKWSALRSDYASTLLKPLYDPKQSAPPSAIIIDLDPASSSCWTQYSSAVGDYASTQLAKVASALAEDGRLKTALVDQGYGPQQVAVILVGERRAPVIFYQSDSMQGPLWTVVTIVQKTNPGFVYTD